MTPDMSPHSAVDVFQFYQMPVQILNLFKPELDAIGAHMQLDAQWESPYFGAGADLVARDYRLMILAGTTRIQGFTLDAYAAMICHELGHILGGAPYQTIPHAEWASSEGQADFFAARICLPRFFGSSDLLRIENAGYDLIASFDRVLAPAQPPITRHPAQVPAADKTLLNTYPSSQCRYENFRSPVVRPACWYRD